MPKANPAVTTSLEEWQLFWVLAFTASIANCAGLPLTDFHSVSGIAPAILRSVRIALPLFLLAFTASSLARLWPSIPTRWLLRNRRYLGLSFAFAMAWHLSFVGYSIFSFGLSASGLSIRGLSLDLVGFFFLLLMTLTSFRWSARMLTIANWQRVHKTGAYVIWFVATYIYAHDLENGLHLIAFSLLITAWLLRITAAGRRRRSAIPMSKVGGDRA